MKNKKYCDFCGSKATNHMIMEDTINLSWCNELECRRKLHIILSTLIPNKYYTTKLVGKK